MKRWLVLLISCLPIFAMAAEPSSLGRLFLTPSERAALDVIRQNSHPPEKIVTPNNVNDDEEGIADVMAPPVVSVQGYVKRSDGKGTVWINGQPVQEKSASKDFEVRRLQGNTNDVQIKLPSTGQTIKLKAGQSYDPANGKVGSLREITPQPEAALTTTNSHEKTLAPQNSPSTEKPVSGNPASAAPTTR